MYVWGHRRERQKKGRKEIKGYFSTAKVQKDL
jgi:hypothetical protein